MADPEPESQLQPSSAFAAPKTHASYVSAYERKAIDQQRDYNPAELSRQKAKPAPSY